MSKFSLSLFIEQAPINKSSVIVVTSPKSFNSEEYASPSTSKNVSKNLLVGKGSIWLILR